MGKQIKLLTKIMLCNVFNINEARYTKDKKKKNRLVSTAIAMLFVIIVLCFYICAITFGYIYIGMQNTVPIFLITISSLVILFFGIFKSGPVIYNLKSYENTIVLPVKPVAIIISRFLTMYIFNFALTLLILVPGTIIYCIAIKMNISFLIMMVLSSAFIPFIPMTVSMIIGAIIYSISSRMKHKSVITVLLSMLVVLALIIAPTFLVNSNNFSQVKITQITTTVFEQIKKVYPPALWFSNSILTSDWKIYILLCVFSVVFFILFAVIISYKFKAICSALSKNYASRNYTMRTQKMNSPSKTLYIKELKRYFASSIYVMNTLTGYILTVIFSIAMLFIDKNTLSQLFPVNNNILKLIPFFLSLLASIAPTTTCSISMEGKQWWIINSLPVTAKSVLNSKLLVNLTVAVPCWFISEVLLIIAFKPGAFDCILLIVIPFIYIIFSSVLGLFFNIKMPMFDWESETVVVKQSRAVFVTMLTGFISVILPILLIIYLPVNFTNYTIIGTIIIISALTIILYCYNNKIKLKVERV